jgi:hypothetical protein
MSAVASVTTVPRPPTSGPSEPCWPVALFFPLQGQWTEAECLVGKRVGKGARNRYLAVIPVYLLLP